MYGMSAISMSKTDINKLTFVYNSIFCKLFKTNALETIQYCQYYSNFLPFVNLLDYNRFCFLKKLHLTGFLKQDCAMDK